MQKYPSFAGVVTELLTPFKQDGSIDFEALKVETEFQIKSGVNGLFTNGLASESLSLTSQEQVEITKFIAQTAAGKIPVMGNIAASALIEAKKILADYENAGADAICFQAPSVYSIPQNDLLAYFNELAASTRKPVGLYNAPQTGNVASPDTVSKFFNQNKNAVYYKESTIDFIHIQNTMRQINKEIEFLNGTDATTLSLMQIGGKGVVSLISSVFPQPVIELVTAAQKGDYKKAREAQNFVLNIREALKIGPFDAGYKYVSGILGRPLGYMRKPLAELNDSEKEKIKSAIISLGLMK
jgi:4-hydroxy-tetrahydrodipicolinate synthase